MLKACRCCFQVFQEHPLMKMYPLPSALPVLRFTEEESGPDAVLMETPVLNQPNTALLSLVLMLGTFFVAFFLRKFRNSRFLHGKVQTPAHARPTHPHHPHTPGPGGSKF